MTDSQPGRLAGLRRTWARAAAYWRSWPHWHHWRRLEPRRQRLLTAVGVVALLACGWALLWQPLQQSRARDAERLAALRAAWQEMQADAAALHALKTQPPVAERTRSLADGAALDALFGGGGQRASTTLRAVDGRTRFDVAIARASFPAVLNGLDEALRRYRLQLVSFEARRLPSVPGEVQARIVLEDARR